MAMNFTRELLKDPREMEKYLIDRGMGHLNMKYYTTQKTARTIVKQGKMYLGNGSSWNDLLDMELYNSDDYKFIQFGKCFCYSRSESVAMWRVYASKKRDCMIDFGTTLSKLVRSLDEVELICSDKKLKIKPKLLKKENGDFEVYLKDVLYFYDNRDDTYTIKIAENRLDKVASEQMGSIMSGCKRMCWSYENECRLTVKVPKSVAILPGTNENDGKFYNSVLIKIPKDIKTLLKDRVYKSPFFPDEKYNIAVTASSLDGNV